MLKINLENFLRNMYILNNHKVMIFNLLNIKKTTNNSLKKEKIRCDDILLKILNCFLQH